MMNKELLLHQIQGRSDRRAYGAQIATGLGKTGTEVRYLGMATTNGPAKYQRFDRWKRRAKKVSPIRKAIWAAGNYSNVWCKRKTGKTKKARKNGRYAR